MDIFSKIEQHHFLATDTDIEALAAERQRCIAASGRANGAYLKILVALTAREIGGSTAHLARRRGRAATALSASEIADHLTVLERVNSRMYAAVLRAVVTPDIERSDNVSGVDAQRRTLERNRRTNYARTAMTVVRAYVQVGQDVRDLDLATVTKESLRQVVLRHAPLEQSVATAKLLKSATRAGERIVAEAAELAAIDPERAETLLASLVETLQETIEKIRAGEIPAADEGSTTTVITNEVRRRATG